MLCEPYTSIQAVYGQLVDFSSTVKGSWTHASIFIEIKNTLDRPPPTLNRNDIPNSADTKLVFLCFLHWPALFSSVQFSSVTQSCATLCDPMDCNTPGLSIHHQLPELTQTHVPWVSDAIQPSHPLSVPSPPTFNLSQNPGLFKRVSSYHQVAKVMEFQIQLQRQYFQWIFRTDFL